jgi:thioredoxin 1
MTKTQKILILLLIAAVLAIGVYAKKGFNPSQAKADAQICAPVASLDSKAVSEVKPDFLRQGLPVLLDLGAEHCIPCIEMAKILTSLENNYKKKLVVKFIDVNKDPDSADAFRIKLIPTQIFFDAKGQEFYRHEGVFTEAQIIQVFKAKGIKV